MKKNYIAPQTEAIKLLGDNAIMAASPGSSSNPLADMLYGGGKSGFGGN